jgi:hypothetical protein
MTHRWFVSTVSIGAAGNARSVSDSRPTFIPRVKMQRAGKNQSQAQQTTFDGPKLQLIGPGDCVGLERSIVVREEPPAGCVDGLANNLAQVEFSDASLPWLLSTPAPVKLPWIALLVLREDEGDIQPGDPAPFIVAPSTALPDLGESASWAHAEARINSDGPPTAAITQDVRSNLDNVVSRLICPRKLDPDTGWLACVVPTTRAGVAVGLDPKAAVPVDGHRPAWSPGQSGGVRLPVYHFWRFRTGPLGSFEDLARRVKPIQADSLAGFGSRKISVRHPWPHADLLQGAPETVTVNVQGALRLPGTETVEEAWSDQETMHRFRDIVRERLNAPASRRIRVGEEADRDDKAVAPPLYGSHHTGVQQVPEDGAWMEALNTQVQFRVAAALGARYVELEQEFLMARAWEQVGAVNEANRMLAAAELAAEAAQAAQAKHVKPMAAAALTQLADVMRTVIAVGDLGPMEAVMQQSAVPDGAASTAFHRLTRRGGALDRRTKRAAETTSMPIGSVLTAGIEGNEVVPSQTATWLAATATVEEGPLAPARVRRDPSATFASQTLRGLLGGQESAFVSRAPFVSGDVVRGLNAFTSAMSESMSATIVAENPLPRPGVLRGLRRSIVKEDLSQLTSATFAVSLGIEALAADIRSSIAPMRQQLDRMNATLVGDTVSAAPTLAANVPVPAPTMADRQETDARPLRPIMAHPVFGFPIGAELLARWPEWAVPGVMTFPEDRSTLMETNSAFVESVLVGLNQEFNRELRWREYPTDEAGTPFSRFWPPGGAEPEYGEIARWAPHATLGEHDPNRGRDLLVLLIRGEVLRRYPGTLVIAAKSDINRRVPAPSATFVRAGTSLPAWLNPKFVLHVDEHTNLYCFDLTPQQARDEHWLFIMREPARGTQFGFDIKTADSPPFDTWANLTWDLVPLNNGFAVRRGGNPPAPNPPNAQDPDWTESDPADFARITFQQPFQLAFSPNMMLPPT